ncbi:MAG: hypothetical protein ABI450_07850 [Rhizomicrobium sp.]
MSLNPDLANPTETARRFGVTVEALRLYEGGVGFAQGQIRLK